jgi:hypothetical protein
MKIERRGDGSSIESEIRFQLRKMDGAEATMRGEKTCNIWHAGKTEKSRTSSRKAGFRRKLCRSCLKMVA